MYAFLPYIKSLLYLVVYLKFKMCQWCNCLTNSLQPPYYCHMNPQCYIAAYHAVDINVQHIFTCGHIHELSKNTENLRECSKYYHFANPFFLQKFDCKCRKYQIYETFSGEIQVVKNSDQFEF